MEESEKGVSTITTTYEDGIVIKDYYKEGDMESVEYKNYVGSRDRLILPAKWAGYFYLRQADESFARIYIKDIPKLIKALEIAQKEWGNDD